MSLGSMFVFDDDGYTDIAFIRGRRNLYPNSRIYFRPATPTSRAEFADSARVDGGSDRATRSNRAFNEAIARQIIKWEVVDDDGNIVNELKDVQGRTNQVPEMTGQMIGKLRQEYHDRLVEIVWEGKTAGDPDPFDRESNVDKTPRQRLEENQKN